MLGFLLTESITIEEDAQKQLEKVSEWEKVVQKALEVLSEVDEAEFETDRLHIALEQALCAAPEGEPVREGSLNLKPRFAFTPLRVGISGRSVSPPLFESMQILGKTKVLERLNALLK